MSWTDHPVNSEAALPFVLKISDSSDNELRIILATAKTGDKKTLSTGSPKLDDILVNSELIEPDKQNVYEIVFSDYIIYQCRNESYTAFDDTEIRSGKYLVIFEKSKLLDYYQDVIFDYDTDDIISQKKHYGIITANHIIDVISSLEPTIRRIIIWEYSE